MRYLITITLAGGETMNVFAETVNMARMAGNLLSMTPGVESVTLHDSKTGAKLNDWLGTAE